MNKKFYCIPAPPLLWILKINSAALILPLLLILAVFLVYFIYKRRKQLIEKSRNIADKKIWDILFFGLAFLAFVVLPFNSGSYSGNNSYNSYYDQKDIYLFSYPIFFGILLAGRVFLKFRGFKINHVTFAILIFLSLVSLLIAVNPSIFDDLFAKPANEIQEKSTKGTIYLTNSLGGCGSFRLW